MVSSHLVRFVRGWCRFPYLKAHAITATAFLCSVRPSCEAVGAARCARSQHDEKARRDNSSGNMTFCPSHVTIFVNPNYIF